MDTDTNGQFQMSATITHLVESLVAANQEFKEILKTETNPVYHSKYADLPAIISATRPTLSKHGLTVIQAPGLIDKEKITVTTLLSHVSGEWIKTETSLPVTNRQRNKETGEYENVITPQSAGAAITYARRYAYSAMLNIAADEDDDGNKASGVGYTKQYSAPTPVKQAVSYQSGVISTPTPQEIKLASADITDVSGDYPTVDEKAEYSERLKQYGLTKEKIRNVALSLTGASKLSEVTKSGWTKIFAELDTLQAQTQVGGAA